ncbi:hypothetical protein TREMEDRAFT_33206 [Tremella mesenterica DSM 1558]|uniref:uncharacterized protein n=1 Tax=Tremella mesenterica (strain ATCC 24925 / CBS 8224 / DSM 1558 / NBRC 9311 / NRRL Y-6157 / RJB 2259-6 / UBC 559-6) TaxID=578456 RepID=UPI0003F49A0E|nr:uncharacterized protein TREMEDRAFT_33206 [Tremella mesenterica DSM 1558]EIW67674.1 hypothetical protein TREMEDRAFT_33206 [Tremella mesenterica DSM 1558]
MTNTLPLNDIILRFPGDEHNDESYQLLELPGEVLKKLEGWNGSLSFPIIIKGRPSDDAVLCTSDATFALRTVTISNSLLLSSTSKTKRIRFEDADFTTKHDKRSRPTLEIRDTRHEILECVPIAGNVERIRTLLRPTAWKGIGSENKTGFEGMKYRNERGSGGGYADDVKLRRKKYTRQQLLSVIQASEVELDKGLKERNVVAVDGTLLLLPPDKLHPILTILLTLLSIHNVHEHSKSVQVPVKEVMRELETYELERGLIRGILSLFGEIDDPENEVWKADIIRLVREVGNGILVDIGEKGMEAEMFLSMWRENVGENWNELVHLDLLKGEHLLHSSTFTSLQTITHFPVHSLPINPPNRFTDLFLTRSPWKAEDMRPFLKGLTRDGDGKELDKLVARHVRVVRDQYGVWWFPRKT